MLRPVAPSHVARAEPSACEMVRLVRQACTSILNMRDQKLAQRAVEHLCKVLMPSIVQSLHDTVNLEKIETELGRLYHPIGLSSCFSNADVLSLHQVGLLRSEGARELSGAALPSANL